MDYTRQLKLLDPSQIKEKSISIAGVGATGSYAASLIAQLGWGNTPQGQGVLKLFDADVVEEHNICNQAFYKRHVGISKVEAMNDLIRDKCGFEVKRYPQMVTDQSDFASTYVMLLTDTMKSRQEIFDNCIKYRFNVDLVIETRMGLKDGRVYAFNPHDQGHVEEWRKTLYKDEEAQESICGASSSIATTAAFVATMAVSRIIEHFNSRYGHDNLGNSNGMWNEFIFSLYPESIMCRRFGSGESQFIQ